MDATFKCRVKRLTKSGVGAALVAALLSGGCSDFNIPNLNQPSVEDLATNPTPSAIRQGAIGLLHDTREATQNIGRTMGHWGREGYSLNVPQGGIGSIIAGPFSPASTRGEWRTAWRNIRTANVILDALDVVDGLTAAEIEGVRGFTKTLMAYDFGHLIFNKKPFGIPIDVNIDPTGDPAAIAPTPAVYLRIIALLDEGVNHLNNAGSAFTMDLPSGLADFDTPATFIAFNRALKARAQVHSDDFAGALSTLAQSFVDTAMPLTFGAYHNFATATGDRANRLFSPAFHYADISFRDNVQFQDPPTNLIRDQRSIDKTVDRTLLTLSGVTSDLEFTIYQATGDPIPWIKNEELILLRAEANLAGGTGATFAAARDDINFVRQNAGNLPAITAAAWAAMTPAARIMELLYNKRMSLPWEYGHSWFDHNHYHDLHGSLSWLPNQHPLPPHNHNQFRGAPFPSAECEARTNRASLLGCGTVEGIF